MAEKVKGVVDIVFLMDATGSMQGCIDGLKENIKIFVDAMTEKNANNDSPVKDWRARVVGFRDYKADGADKWLEPNVFTRDVAVLRKQLDDLLAFGGGDEPESLLDAIYMVANFGQNEEHEGENPESWRYRRAAARVVVIFTDATYHPKMDIPKAKGGTVSDIINLIHTNRLVLSIYAPDKMPCYDELSKADKADYMPLVDEEGNMISLDEYTQNKENFQETLRQLAKTVSKTAATEVL